MSKDFTDVHYDPVQDGDFKSIGTFTVVINRFDEFVSMDTNLLKIVYSKPVNIRGLPWRIRIDSKCVKTATRSSRDLEMYLFCMEPDMGENFECTVRATFAIHAAQADVADKVHKFTKEFHTKRKAWGFKNFANCDNLTNGFVSNNSIHLSAVIKVSEPTGMKVTRHISSPKKTSAPVAAAVDSALADKVGQLEDTLASTETAIALANTKIDQLRRELTPMAAGRTDYADQMGLMNVQLDALVKELRSHSDGCDSMKQQMREEFQDTLCVIEERVNDRYETMEETVGDLCAAKHEADALMSAMREKWAKELEERLAQHATEVKLMLEQFKKALVLENEDNESESVNDSDESEDDEDDTDEDENQNESKYEDANEHANATDKRANANDSSTAEASDDDFSNCSHAVSCAEQSGECAWSVVDEEEVLSQSDL